MRRYGDAGNRTRVQKIRPRIYYKLSRSIVFSPATTPTGGVPGQPANDLWRALLAWDAPHPSFFVARCRLTGRESGRT